MRFKIKDLGVDVHSWPIHLTGPFCECKGQSMSDKAPPKTTKLNCVHSNPQDAKQDFCREKTITCGPNELPVTLPDAKQAGNLYFVLADVLDELRAIATKGDT